MYSQHFSHISSFITCQLFPVASHDIEPKIYDEWEFEDSDSNSGPGSSPKPTRPRHIQTKSGAKWVTDDPGDTQQDTETHLGSDQEPPTEPGSDIRWIGLSLAHRKSYEERVSVGKGDNKKEKEKGVGFSIIITSVVGGVFLFLLTISLLVFTWYVQLTWKSIFSNHTP